MRGKDNFVLDPNGDKDRAQIEFSDLFLPFLKDPFQSIIFICPADFA